MLFLSVGSPNPTRKNFPLNPLQFTVKEKDGPGQDRGTIRDHQGRANKKGFFFIGLAFPLVFSDRFRAGPKGPRDFNRPPLMDFFKGKDSPLPLAGREILCYKESDERPGRTGLLVRDPLVRFAAVQGIPFLFPRLPTCTGSRYFLIPTLWLYADYPLPANPPG